MEAFAEVARLLVPDWHVVAEEDVDFLTPVKFYRGEPRTVTITAASVPTARTSLPTAGSRPSGSSQERVAAADGPLHRTCPAVDASLAREADAGPVGRSRAHR